MEPGTVSAFRGPKSSPLMIHTSVSRCFTVWPPLPALPSHLWLEALVLSTDNLPPPGALSSFLKPPSSPGEGSLCLPGAPRALC